MRVHGNGGMRGIIRFASPAPEPWRRRKPGEADDEFAAQIHRTGEGNTRRTPLNQLIA